MNSPTEVNAPKRSRDRLWRTALHTLLWCLACGVLLQNILLIRKNHQLSESAKPPEVNVGKRVGDLAAISLGGTFTRIELPTRKTDKLLIIAMSPTCPICDLNRRGWAEMTAQLAVRDNWRVVWLSRDSIQLTLQWAKKHGIPPDNVLAEPVHATYDQLGLEVVPHSVVINATGIVDKVWSGRLNPELTKEMMSYFSNPQQGSAAVSQLHVFRDDVPKFAGAGSLIRFQHLDLF